MKEVLKTYQIKVFSDGSLEINEIQAAAKQKTIDKNAFKKRHKDKIISKDTMAGCSQKIQQILSVIIYVEENWNKDLDIFDAIVTDAIKYTANKVGHNNTTTVISKLTRELSGKAGDIDMVKFRSMLMNYFINDDKELYNRIKEVCVKNNKKDTLIVKQYFLAEQ